MEIIFRLVQLKQKMRHRWCLGLELGYLLINGCSELCLVESRGMLSDGPLLMVGLSRIFRITWHFGEQCVGDCVS